MSFTLESDILINIAVAISSATVSGIVTGYFTKRHAANMYRPLTTVHDVRLEKAKWDGLSTLILVGGFIAMFATLVVAALYKRFLC